MGGACSEARWARTDDTNVIALASDAGLGVGWLTVCTVTYAPAARGDEPEAQASYLRQQGLGRDAEAHVCDCCGVAWQCAMRVFERHESIKRMQAGRLFLGAAKS